MKQIRILAMCLALVASVAVFGSTASAGPSSATAPVQAELCAGGSGDYPPTDPGSQVVTLTLDGGSVVPGGSATFSLTGAEPGETYCGLVYSTVFQVTGTADANGALVLNGTAPADFDLAAFHRLEVYDAILVGNFKFCIDASGTVGPDSACVSTGVDLPSTGSGDSSLASTGADQVESLLKLAAVLIAAGAGMVFFRRRRVATQV